MSRYIYEVELRPDDDGYCVRVPDLDGCFTEGDSVSNALNMADDALKTFVAALLKYGEHIPDPTFGHAVPEGGMVVALSFETDASYIVEEVSPSEAAEMLGVSRSRVSHMIRDGVLHTTACGGEIKVTLESVDAYMSSPRRAGRPKKVEA
jgi:excisionase family DNA binding protein